jgi:hypothetical protein
MNDVALLERLGAAYDVLEAPAPSAELAARMDAGWIGDADDDRAQVVVPFTPRPRVRVRYLIAAVVASFVAMSGLAVAGELPDGLQREVSAVVSHIGIDLPAPSETPTGPPATHDGANGGGGGGSSTPGAQGGGAGNGKGAGTATGKGADNPSPTTPTTTPGAVKPGAGETGGGATTPPGGTPTTTPPVGAEGAGDPPPTTSPPVTLPPITLPPIQLPPISLPPIDLPLLPPISLPPISLPPIQLPPLLGL